MIFREWGKHMKLNLRKLMFVTVIIILTFSSIIVHAKYQEGVPHELYNKGELVNLTYPLLIDGDDAYIAFDDLNNINVDYEEYEDCVLFYRLNANRSQTQCELSIEENMVYSDKYEHEDATTEVDGVAYIKLVIISKEFSSVGSCSLLNDVYKHKIHINDYTTETFNFTVSLPEEQVATTNGYDVTVYYGKRSNVRYATTAQETVKYLGYNGLDVKSIPDATDLTKMSEKNMPSITISESFDLTIHEGKNSASKQVDIKVRNALPKNYGNSGGGFDIGSSSGGSYGSGSGGMYTSYVGYIVDNKYFIGGDYVPFKEGAYEYTFTIDDCYEKSSIEGKIVLPKHDKTIGYTVVAEANRVVNGISIKRDYVFKTTGSIGADSEEGFFDIPAIAGYEYDVYVVFDDEEYARQYKKVITPTDGESLTFDNFVEASCVTGKLVIPSKIKDSVDYYGDGITSISGNIVLQNAEYPHEYLDKYEFNVDVDTTEINFVLSDDIGVENAILYYELHEDIIGIYGCGNYRNNDTVVPNVKDATIISTNQKDVILTVPDGNTIQIVIDCGCNEPHFTLRALKQNKDDGIRGLRETDLSICSSRTNRVYGEKIQYIYCLTFPEDVEYYSLMFSPSSHNVDLYSVGDGYTKDIAESKLFKVDDGDISIRYIGYSEQSPFVFGDIEYSFENEKITLNIENEYECAYNEKSVCYIALYDTVGCLIDILSVSVPELAGFENINISFYLEKEKYIAADTLKVMVWADNLMPLANMRYVKQANQNEQKYATLWARCNENTYYVNGTVYNSDIAPVIKNETIYMPVRMIAESLNVNVDYNGNTDTITVNDGNNELILFRNSETSIYNGNEYTLNYPTEDVNGRWIIDCVELSNLFGYDTRVDMKTGIILVLSEKDSLVNFSDEYQLLSNAYFNNEIWNNVTRGEVTYCIVDFIERMNGRKIQISDDASFPDTDDEKYLKALSLGIVGTYPDGTFRPHLSLTRAEMCKLVYSMMNNCGCEFNDAYDKTQFTDVESIHWAYNFIHSLKRIGVFKNVFEDTLGPENYASKEDFATIIANCYNYLINTK